MQIDGQIRDGKAAGSVPRLPVFMEQTLRGKSITNSFLCPGMHEDGTSQERRINFRRSMIDSRLFENKNSVINYWN